MLGKNGDHLNAYVLADIIKKELQAASDDALQAKLGKNVRKPPSKTQIGLKNKRKHAMADLRDNANTGDALRTYMIHMGSMSEKYEKKSKVN